MCIYIYINVCVYVRVYSIHVLPWVVAKRQHFNVGQSMATLAATQGPVLEDEVLQASRQKNKTYMILI